MEWVNNKCFYCCTIIINYAKSVYVWMVKQSVKVMTASKTCFYIGFESVYTVTRSCCKHFRFFSLPLTHLLSPECIAVFNIHFGRYNWYCSRKCQRMVFLSLLVLHIGRFDRSQNNCESWQWNVNNKKSVNKLNRTWYNHETEVYIICEFPMKMENDRCNYSQSL